MAIKKGEWLLILFNTAYLIGFAVYYYSIRHFEFLWYMLTMVVYLTVIVALQRKIKFSYLILWLLSVWGILHMIGGMIIKEAAVYETSLIPIWITENFYILKFDQLMHAYLYFVMVFVIWHLLKNSLGKTNYWVIYPFIVLASAGIGALNEISEFMTVLAFEQTGVGGYYNTAWDLVFNTIGAILGAIALYFLKIKEKRKKFNITPHR